MGDLKYLSRDEILGAFDIMREDVAVPEWGGKVCVQGMTGAQRDAFEAEIVQGRGKDRSVNLQNIRAKLVARTVVDPESGVPLFSEEDIKALGKKSAKALARVYDVAARLSGISDKDAEELAGNSDDDPSGGSTSD
ncbi:MAG: hypothetical protein ACM3US_09780 [Sphingomonadaceae bacterium]